MMMMMTTTMIMIIIIIAKRDANVDSLIRATSSSDIFTTSSLSYMPGTVDTPSSMQTYVWHTTLRQMFRLTFCGASL